MAIQNVLRFLLCGALLLPAAGCGRGSEHGQSGKPPLAKAQVKVFSVADQQSVQARQVAGSVEAVEQAVMAAKMPGLVQAIPVEIGSPVKKGQLLLTMAAPEIEARLAQAQIGLEQARRNYEREKRLLEKDAATREGVKLQEEGVRIAEAGVREASGMLANARLVAPFDGVVTKKLIKVGDLATPGLPLLEVANPARLQVVASAPESMVAGLKVGDSVAVSVPSTNLATEGVVEHLSPGADPATRSSVVKLRLANAAGLRTGQYAQVTMPGAASPAVLVPVAAVRRQGQMEQLFVVRDDVARLRLVRTGEQQAGMVEIISGLVSGEKVVAAADKLSDGQPVQIVP
ncbi:MAG: efflux RND transporter periplasmic adaptor subunit [Thermodesulfobacteriota bacterium]